MSAIEAGSPVVPEQLVRQLVAGYDALSVEVKRIHEQHRELENKLSWAKQQYLDALKRFTPDHASKDFHDFLSELEEAGACEKEGDRDWLDQLAQSQDEEKRAHAYSIHLAEDARQKIDYRRKSIDASHGVRIWSGKSAEGADVLERDFTTPGTPSRLGCPFVPNRTNGVNGSRGATTPRSSISKVSLGRRSKRPSFHDPIRAEVCGNVGPSTEPSIEGSLPLCPIRFLDKHSPEEVAQYFEQHKHQLPRSHEFCVKRFQENEQALASLDSKYANIVSMVKELGKVHEPMLPAPDDIAIEDEDDMPNSTSKVERWAQDVSGSNEAIDANADGPIDDDRQSHFDRDRSLKDIRVGESPSRPWGIQVPADFDGTGDAKSKRSDPTASPIELPTSGPNAQAPPPMACPFSGKLAANENPHHSTNLPKDHSRNPPEPMKEDPSPRPHPNVDLADENPRFPPSATKLVFNGPVFFGYSFDQAMAMMKQSGFSG